MLLIQVFAVGINPELDFTSKKWIEGCNVNPRMGSSGVPVANCRMWCKDTDPFLPPERNSMDEMIWLCRVKKKK